MKAYIKSLHTAASWAFLSLCMGSLTGCCLITVPVKTAVSVTGTVVTTVVKVVTAPVRWISDSIADDSNQEREKPIQQGDSESNQSCL
ncbi:MAG: hypothetical protein AVO38_11230 [delta proteobacterium ML8_D]|jgi:hypothetical protein|nr:MAG: hypothetical protein AVO38_11230 [delta proteobacterium ML8_D]